MTASLEGGEWSIARPGRTLPQGKNRYPLYRRLSGPQGRSGRAENLVPTGIRSRTVQPVVSRYTDWATGPTYFIRILNCHQYYCQYFLNSGSLTNVHLFPVLHFEFPLFCCVSLHLNLIMKLSSFPTLICKFSQILKYLFYSKNCFRILLFSIVIWVLERPDVQKG